MQSRDILWAISIPFRMINSKEIDMNTFTFTLSFDAALRNCSVSAARQLIQMAIDKGWIERVENTNKIRAKFELWKPKFFPPTWRPNFAILQKGPMIDLSPLNSAIEYKPKSQKRIKKASSREDSIFTRSKPIKTEKIEKREILNKKTSKEQSPKDKAISDVKKKPSTKKKKVVKKVRKKAQKSIQDFFK